MLQLLYPARIDKHRRVCLVEEGQKWSSTAYQHSVHHMMAAASGCAGSGEILAFLSLNRNNIFAVEHVAVQFIRL